jgi:hypothetical protein
VADRIHLATLLAQSEGRQERTASFAFLCLGIVESLLGGALMATDSVRVFFHAENCDYVRKKLKIKAANEIMSRGVQLPDVFDALAPEVAFTEFQRELGVMRALCLDLLQSQRAAA